jgi:hypothetical protein
MLRLPEVEVGSTSFLWATEVEPLTADELRILVRGFFSSNALMMVGQLLCLGDRCFEDVGCFSNLALKMRCRLIFSYNNFYTSCNIFAFISTVLSHCFTVACYFIKLFIILSYQFFVESY